MKNEFTLGAEVRTRGKPHHYGRLVEGPPRFPAHAERPFPHYSGEGWYYVRWEGKAEIYVALEDDLELAPPPHPPLYKTTIVVWSEFDPSDGRYGDEVLSGLGREAERGDAYCPKSESNLVQDPSRDPDWEDTEFFRGEGPSEGGPPHDAATDTGVYDHD